MYAIITLVIEKELHNDINQRAEAAFDLNATRVSMQIAEISGIARSMDMVARAEWIGGDIVAAMNTGDWKLAHATVMNLVNGRR